MQERNKPQKLGYWPSVEYIRQRTVMGSQRAGIGVIGEGNDTDGSRLIIQLVDEADERPIWFCAGRCQYAGSGSVAGEEGALEEELDRFSPQNPIVYHYRSGHTVQHAHESSFIVPINGLGGVCQ